MSETKHATKPFDIEGMPPGIPYIVGNEAAERFSFYGMKAILTVFMTQYLLGADGEVEAMSDPQARFWVHTFVVAAYFFPLAGALISDWLFGKYKTILLLSIVYCLGHFCLAMDETRWGLGIGLALISIGTGAIKPCVSAHVGDQFGTRNKHLLPKIFGWFYVAINLGAFLSTLLTPILLNKTRFYEVFGEGLRDVAWLTPGPSLAFGVPGILMAIATVVFWMGRNTFVHVPARGKELFKDCFTGEGKLAILRLLPIYAFVAMFWCLFDQTASAWVLQAKNMDLEVNLFGKVIEVLPSQLQATNPFFILMFVPLFAYVIYPALDKSFGLTPLRKIAIGMFLAVVAFSVSGWIETQISAGETPSIGWQVLAYAILTAAEVMVSITCLEFSYTQSPNSMKSVIMSLYLLSVAAGNEFTAIVNLLIEKSDGTSRLPGADYYWFFTGCMFVAAVGFLYVVKTYQGKTYIQDEDAPTAHAVEMEADAEGTEH
ncbi:MAG: POT family MFS transporter [Planctomycetaceae bacterium]|nr:POT family MFS transporter [Planctomycetaceae bacterium]